MAKRIIEEAGYEYVRYCRAFINKDIMKIMRTNREPSNIEELIPWYRIPEMEVA